MGGDFQQYRANVACGRQDCAYTSTLGKFQNFFQVLTQLTLVDYCVTQRVSYTEAA